MPQFTTTRRVEFANTDMAGIVHFANFYRWMEEAEHDFFRSLDIPIMSKPVQGNDGRTAIIGWPRVSAQCSFQAPAHYEDVLEIHVNVERIGFKSLTFHVEFFCDGKPLAKGRMKTACCRCMADGKLESIPIPQHYLDKLSEWPGEQ